MTYQKTLAALADPTRREILDRLREVPISVGALAAGLPVSRPAVSQHLRVLKDAGLVRERREGTRRIYSVQIAGLAGLRAYLEGFWGDVLASFEESVESDHGGDDARRED